MTNQADDIYEAGKRIMKERHNALKEKSKPLKDLVVSEIFEVIMVNKYTENMIVSHFDYHTPIGAIPTSEAGCKSKIIIKVKPLSKDPKNIIDTLLFDGFSHIVVENYITAKIPRYGLSKLIYILHNLPIYILLLGSSVFPAKLILLLFLLS